MSEAKAGGFSQFGEEDSGRHGRTESQIHPCVVGSLASRIAKPGLQSSESGEFE